MNLEKLGWNDFFEGNIDHSKSDKKYFARVTAVHRSHLRAITLIGKEIHELNLHLSGKMQFGETDVNEWPTVGDWVEHSPFFIDEQNQPGALVLQVLPRQSQISRVQAGSGLQTLAANVDYAFVVTSANADLA